MLTGYLGEAEAGSVRTELSDDEYWSSYRNWIVSSLKLKTEYLQLCADVLLETPFVTSMHEDMRRAKDALELRDLFSNNTGAVLASGEDPKDLWPCTALEVIVSMAMAMEYNALETPFSTTEDNVSYFYKVLLENLTIERDPGGNWDQKRRMIGKVLRKWMERRYSKDGTGGLFPLRHSRENQRDVELWYQMNAYIHENYWT